MSSRRQHLSNQAWRMLRAIRAAGGSAAPDALLAIAGDSWHGLLRTVGALETRGLVRLRPGVVFLTRAGQRVAGGPQPRFAGDTPH